MKLGRHIKGKFKFSHKSQKRLENKAEFFNELSYFYLFQFNHHGYQRRPFVAPGNWDIFGDVILDKPVSYASNKKPAKIN